VKGTPGVLLASSLLIRNISRMSFRNIPSIEQLRQRDGIRPLEDRFGHSAVVDALRAEADAMRERMAKGDAPADVAAAMEEVR
jgi:Selenocysteine synthase N terminal